MLYRCSFVILKKEERKRAGAGAEFARVYPEKLDEHSPLTGRYSDFLSVSGAHDVSIKGISRNNAALFSINSLFIRVSGQAEGKQVSTDGGPLPLLLHVYIVYMCIRERKKLLEHRVSERTRERTNERADGWAKNLDKLNPVLR